jgi:hypothetical protein
MLAVDPAQTISQNTNRMHVQALRWSMAHVRLLSLSLSFFHDVVHVPFSAVQSYRLRWHVSPVQIDGVLF